jgi:hypothetical protein
MLFLPPSCRFPPLREGNPIGSVPPCLQGEPKGGGEKFRLFSNTLLQPLDKCPRNGVE